MVNDRLVHVLESRDLMSKVQCGFRKDHSTLDHLIRLETFIKKAFARKKQVLVFFFDLEKAYDSTWRRFCHLREGKHLQYLECTIQLCINTVQKRVSENGFRFSVSKTTCVHFHRQRIYTEPALNLDGQSIPVKGEAKFLGDVFDSKLSFTNHVQYIKKKCLKALNLLRVVGHIDWSADRATLLKLYRTLVRSKLDYGSVVYGSAKKHVLRALDPIHHQGLCIALGTFRTSPIKSLYAEAGESSLEHRRIKLAFYCVLKLKSLPRNPCHDVVFEAPLSNFSDDSKSESNLVANTFEHIKNAKINLNTIDNLHVQCPPPWEEHQVHVDISLTKQKKEDTSEVAYRKGNSPRAHRKKKKTH
ncbi:Pol-like protein [Plakobranchus ocellatus]|uniref:Pol-like protein n=1 Tax=Plakobranchus ocellatus TaxID=259542 RepID=A0AAV4DLG7_9GAST|nr:Pol-like protein [Plakobranchus ocellatus]